MSKENLSSGIITIFGNHVTYSMLGSDNVTLQATLLSNYELVKKLTGLTGVEDCENVFNAEAIGLLSYNGVKKTFGDKGYYKGFNLAYQPCAQTDATELAECLEYRINMVKEFVKHCDWIAKVETFNFKGLDVKIKRVTETSNSFPLRFFIDGVKQSPYWTEFINQLITLSFEDRAKYLTIENSQKDGLSVIVKVNNKKKKFLIHNSTEPEVGEFKETINKAIISAAEFLERCLAELKPKQHVFNLSVEPKPQHPVFNFDNLLVTDGYKTQHHIKQEIPEMLKHFFIADDIEKISILAAEHSCLFDTILNNVAPRGIRRSAVLPEYVNVNPLVLEGFVKTIRARDQEIIDVRKELDNVYKAKADLLAQLTQAITQRSSLKIELQNAVEQLSVYQKREAKIAEVDALTEKIESFNK